MNGKVVGLVKCLRFYGSVSIATEEVVVCGRGKKGMHSGQMREKRQLWREE